MKRSKAGKRPPKASPPPPVAKLEGRRNPIPKPAIANPKIGAQARRLLGKHYASKYQTMRRG
jgi:hypothetical protein